MANDVVRLEATAIDGRLRNPFWRLEQLGKLREALVSRRQDIEDAIVADGRGTEDEARIEWTVTAEMCQGVIARLDPKAEVKEEYCVARTQSFTARRVPIGLVYIDPAAHTLLYSALEPLAVAIAAGNCVALKACQNFSRQFQVLADRIWQITQVASSLPGVLRQLLTEALDPDIFAPTQVEPEAWSASGVRVLQNTALDAKSPASPLGCDISSRVVAIVDRTANLDEAAKWLTLARFSFGGKSSFAPDLVLVNEFVKQDLLAALARHAVKYAARSLRQSNGVSPKDKSVATGLRDAEIERGGHAVSMSSSASIVEVLQRSSQTLQSKVAEPCLFVHSARSLDDAIDLSHSMSSSQKEERLLACYVFAEPKTAKYVSESVSTWLAIVNHVPADLLLGPAAPVTCDSEGQYQRYSASMFSVSSPQIVSRTTTSDAIFKVLHGEDRALLGSMEASQAKQLKVMPSRSDGKSTGFFERGIFLGLGTVGVPILGLTSMLLLRAARWGISHWKA